MPRLTTPPHSHSRHVRSPGYMPVRFMSKSSGPRGPYVRRDLNPHNQDL